MKDTGSIPKNSQSQEKTNGESFLQKTLHGTGVFLVIFTAGIVVSLIAGLIQGSSKHPSSDIGATVFLAGLVFLGLRKMKGRAEDQRALKELREEQSILKHAKAVGNSLTVSETSLHCQFRIADTKKAFERLALTGVCRVDVTDEGELCYCFPSFSSSHTSEVSVLDGQTIHFDQNVKVE